MDWEEFILAQIPGSTVNSIFEGDLERTAYGAMGYGGMLGVGMAYSYAVTGSVASATSGLTGFLFLKRIQSIPLVIGSTLVSKAMIKAETTPYSTLRETAESTDSYRPRTHSVRNPFSGI